MQYSFVKLVDARGIARQYLQTSLDASDRELSAHLRTRNPMADGSIFALTFPARFDESCVVYYAHGLFAGGELAALGGSPDDAFAEFASWFLATEIAAGIVLENGLARREDPCVSRYRTRVAFHGNDVYHLLGPADAGTEMPVEAIREAYNSRFLIAVFGRDVHLPEGEVSTSHSSILWCPTSNFFCVVRSMASAIWSGRVHMTGVTCRE